MAQLFSPSANTIAKGSLFAGLFGVATVGLVYWFIETSPYVTWAGIARDQPIPFSHEHHVGGLGIDCRYCHTSVEDSNFAGLPPTKTCMTCHSVIWNNAEMLEPVRRSWRENEPIVWQRVHNLPGYVYFNHSIHVNKGIGCATCHGDVDRMPLMYQNGSLQMAWCLDCHRQPQRFIRPRDEIFNLHYDPAHDPKRPGETQATLGPKLVKEYHILPSQQMEDCFTCHR
ncbi:MAG TPA: cytochrome c3 family protein [Tepidisphaeraceae bacterium]